MVFLALRERQQQQQQQQLLSQNCTAAERHNR